jgi:predicted Zn-dependent protease
LAARDAWNSATDQNGNKTGYYFKVDQGSTQPNILIVQGITQSGCSETNFNTNPPHIVLPADTSTNYTDDEIKGKIMHEIGHTLGLAQENGCSSIMNDSSSTCPHFK